MSTALENLLVRHLEAGTIPGAVAVLAPPAGDPEVVAVGTTSLDGPAMRADAIMRISR